ncbi:MAG: endolytic transglycosylase MltG [Desulfobacteraceae bacterium]
MKKYVKKTGFILGIGFILAGIACSAGVWTLAKFARTPLEQNQSDQTPSSAAAFSVRSGQALKTISNNLETKKIITSSLLFQIYARYRGQAGSIKAGEYVMSPAMSPEEILGVLVKGTVKLYRLTVPEGLTIEETAVLVEKAGLGTQEMFTAGARDREFAEKLGISAPSLEGYLFPETYFFPKNSSVRTIITTMVERFNIVFSDQWHQRAKEMGMSRHDIVILASIVEKETGDASERPIIASVFHNRLKKGMRLESDPTVIYGMPDFNGNITRRDLRTKTPYNTYKIAGLPLGPIANPGKMSLKAVLFPANTDFLFFVSKKDTTHKFSRTLREHNRAVRKYQLNH